MRSAATVGLALARPAGELGVESFFPHLVSGIQQVLAERRLGLLFQVVEDLAEECATYRRWQAERRVDGVLVVDPRVDDPRLDLLDALALPGVLVGGAASEAARHPALSSLWIDDAAAMALVVDHLHALGHRRIVHIAGLPELAHTQRRIAALHTAAELLGLLDVRSVTTDYSDAQGASATRRALEGSPAPTALVYDNDVLAMAGAAVAAGRGLAVPDDLSIVAWEDSVLCRMARPRLTALSRDAVALGRAAAEQVTALLDSGTPRYLHLPAPELLVRGSTAAVRRRGAAGPLRGPLSRGLGSGGLGGRALGGRQRVPAEAARTAQLLLPPLGE